MRQIRFLLSLLLMVVCWQQVLAQSDIEITDSVSTEWGDSIGGGLLPNMPYYEIVYVVDGVEYHRDSIICGNPVTPPDAPTKEGYIFSGWSDVPEVMPAHDVTVTGSFLAVGINSVEDDKLVVVYTVGGVLVKRNVSIRNLSKILPKGILYTQW